MCFPSGRLLKNPPANVGDSRDAGLIPGLGRCPGVGNGNPLQYSCLEKFHGQRSLVGYNPQDHKESDMTEHSYTHSTWFLQLQVRLNIFVCIHLTLVFLLLSQHHVYTFTLPLFLLTCIILIFITTCKLL